VVARAKLSYARVSVPPVAVSAPKEDGEEDTSTADKVTQLPQIACTSHPGWGFDFEAGLQGLVPLNGDQSAGLALVPVTGRRGEQALALTNLCTGGDFGVRLPLDGLDLSRVKEIGLDCAIPASVAVNLYFCFKDDPLERFFVQLSGPGESAPNVTRLGEFGSFAADGKWHRVSFNPAETLRQALPWRESFVVGEVVIGMLHEGYLNAGCGGNKQGASFVVDNLRVVSVGPAEVAVELRPPVVAAEPQALPQKEEAEASEEKEPVSAKEEVAVEDVPEVVSYEYRSWLSRSLVREVPPAEVESGSGAEFALAAPEGGVWGLHSQVRLDGSWQVLPVIPLCVAETLGVVSTCPAEGESWGGEPVEVRFDLESEGQPDLSGMTLTVGDTAVRPGVGNANYDVAAKLLTIDVGRTGLSIADGSDIAFGLEYTDSVDASGAVAGVTNAVSQESTRLCRWKARMDYSHDKTPPGPVQLLGDEYIVLDFNHGVDGVKPTTPNGAVRVVCAQRGVGNKDLALQVLNRVCGSDFGVSLYEQRFSAGEYPLLAFDYRVDSRVRVDFLLKRKRKQVTVRFMDKDEEATPAGRIADVKADGKWHHAEVNLADLVADPNARYSANCYDMTRLTLGDGGYRAVPPGVSYAIDNVTLVPVVRGKDDLRLKWQASDLSGIHAYSYAWNPEPETKVDTVAETSESGALFGDLPDGKTIFHIRAQDGAGNWGEVSRFHFLVDNLVPTVTSVHPESGVGAADSRILVEFGEGIASLDPAGFEMTVNDAECALTWATTRWDTRARTLSWDFTKARRSMRKVIPDGKEMKVCLVSARDFAGNEMEPYEWTWQIDYSKDKEGPDAPRIWCYTQRAQYDHFSGDNHAWRVYGAQKGSELTTVVDPDTGDHCLRFRKVAQGKRFGAFRGVGKASIADTPIVSFDYKIMPGTKVSLLVNLDGVRYGIVLTGDEQITALGRVEDATDDGKWHHAIVKLAELLKAKFPDKKDPRCQQVYFGDWRAKGNEVGAEFFIDNFAMVASGPPLPWIHCGAADPTGIAGFDIGFDRDPWGKTTESFPAKTKRVPVAGVDEEGMWFIHVRARDGAGNIGRPAHYPYLCTQAFAGSVDEGLETGEGWVTWSKNRRGRCWLQPGKTAGGGNQFMSAQLYIGGKTEVEIRRKTKFRVGAHCSIAADLFHSAKEPMKIAAYVRRHGDKERIASEPVELAPHVWKRAVTFDLPPGAFSPEEADGVAEGDGVLCQEMGFVVLSSKKLRTSLLIDSVKFDHLPQEKGKTKKGRSKPKTQSSKELTK